jgi:hypothetical protein
MADKPPLLRDDGMDVAVRLDIERRIVNSHPLRGRPDALNGRHFYGASLLNGDVDPSLELI